jgi:hypothetical protein
LAFSRELIERTSGQIRFYRNDFESDTPIKIHGYGVDDGHGLGGPPLNPEFESWLGPICFCGRKGKCAPGCRATEPSEHLKDCERGCPSNRVSHKKRGYRTESRLRTTKALRKLRKLAPREFDAVYLMTAHKASFWTVLKSFNERAERLGKPMYRPEDIMLLIVSGVDKLDEWWAS